MLVFAFIVACVAVTSALYAPDEILSLPGWEGKLPSKQYSGYLNVSDTRLHYWMVESESSPETSPVVLWFNGGPGCSSLDGYFYEHGPFAINADHKTLSLRPHRWNLNANTLYIEAPVGVGFSYSETKSYSCDDDRTANENRAAVEQFYKMFPEYKNNKFFITGESYAGIYVPTLAEAILTGQNDGSYTGATLTGIAVGNGCSGTEVGICGSGPQGTWTEWSYLVQTGFVETGLKTAINAECDWAKAAVNDPNALSAKCVSLLNQASAQIGNVNLYNIYGDCINDMCAAEDSVSTVLSPYRKSVDSGKLAVRGKVPMRPDYVVTEGEHSRRLGRIIPHGPNACIDSGAASGYLNQPEVMAAIHVRDPGFCWGVCNTAKGWSYKSTRTNLPANTYPALVKAMHVLIYNGDWDACVPYTDGVAWTEGMGLPVKNPWHSWTFTSSSGADNQVGGYATSYDVGTTTTGSFAFITIKGGRHEVPITAPMQALEMLNRVIAGAEF